MTRMHFVRIAAVINMEWKDATQIDDQEKRETALAAIAAVAHGLAREMKGFNERFDKERFLAACFKA